MSIQSINRPICPNPVINAQELRHLLKNELKPENFSPGENYENVLNGTFRANLHIHTTCSDGIMSPKEVLDQAEKYAEYRKSLGLDDPFIVAITDHDTLEGTKEALKIIEEHPENYENICFVPGIEFSSFYHDGKEKKQIELVGYCINPYKTDLPKEKDVAKFVDDMSAKNEVYLKQLVKRLNLWEEKAGISKKEQTTLDGIKKYSAYLKSLGSPGFMDGVEYAFGETFKKRGWPRRPNDGINIIMQRHNANYGDKGINPGTKSAREIAEVVNKSGWGFVGIAHPGRNFHGKDLRFSFLQFKKYGIEAAETDYQYPPQDGVNVDFKNHINLASEQSGMLKTGGLDTHKDNIFTGREANNDLKSLPLQIQDILL